MVTGGAGGIGEACVRHLAKTYKIVVIDINEAAVKKIADEVGGVGLACDITSEQSVGACVEAAEKAAGPLAGLLNCAGTVQEKTFAPEEFEVRHWDQVQAINTRGTWLVSREVGARMAKRGKGSIVVIASIAGQRAWPTHSYAASKAATISIARGLAVEWGRSGVRVNSLSPGFTMTPRMKEMA
jgi:NAD(P)-dependent dehydrogenase (short-subunit alcohol dehydrogenase family)